MTIAALLLAAGRSTRFGTADKLRAELRGLPLALHAVNALMPLPLTSRFVVTASASSGWPGFETVVNDMPEAGMAHSIGLGLGAVRRSGADAVLIALADMPFVPTRHFRRLLESHRGGDSIVASSDGTRRMPPALFGAKWFADLQRLTGDQGARRLFDRADVIVTAAEHLRDIDRPDDLAIAQADRSFL